MHTAIEQKLQNMNSYVFENFQPQEIDLFINNMQEAFIKQRLYPDSNPKRRGFEDTSKRLADLQTIVKEVTLLPIIDNTSPDERKYLLSPASPGAVTGTVSGSSYQIVTVGNTNFMTIGAPNNNVGTVFTASGAGTGTGTVAAFDFFVQVSMRVNLVVNVRPLVLETGIATRYLGMAKDTTSAVLPVPARGDFYISAMAGTVLGHVVAKNALIYYNGTAWIVKDYPVYNFPVYNKPVRIVEHENLYNNQENPYAKATERSPLGVIRENTLVMPCGERFILKDLFMVYLRKPRAVSLTSSYNCELPEHTHLEIVDLVVNHILEVIESQRYQSSSQESLKNE